MRTTVDIPDNLWKEFEAKAVKLYGRHGSIKRGIMEAITQWLKTS